MNKIENDIEQLQGSISIAKAFKKDVEEQIKYCKDHLIGIEKQIEEWEHELEILLKKQGAI